MTKMRDKMEKLRREAEEQGINISEDALFIVSEISETIRSEIRDTRNILLIFLSVVIGLIVAFGVAILTLGL